MLTVGTGSSDPFGVAVADVDGDGKLDLIVSDHNASAVWVYRNISTGGMLTSNSFAPPVSFNVGVDPRTIVVCDLDGDNRPDIIVGNVGSSTISILRNIGVAGSITTNSFAPRVDLPTGSGPEGLAVGDLDGDGKPDLVCTCDGGSFVSLYRNACIPGAINTSSFGSRVDLPAPSYTSTVVIGDIDGDGKSDLVVGSYGSSLVSVFRNISTPGSLGTNSFASRVSFGAGGKVHTVSLADLNGTGSTPLSYRWIFNGTNIVGATNLTFSLVNVQITNAGTYAVIVTNVYGSAISSNAVLTIGIPPAITNQPASQRVSIGCDVVFNANAGGTSPLSYQWWKAGSTLSGQTNTSLTLTNVQTGDFTNYYVVVTNLFGYVASSNAVLVQDHPPVAVQDVIQRLANSEVKVKVSTLLANDSDPDGDPLTFLGVSANSVAGGTVSWSGNWVYYLPPAGYTNSDAFTYTISDGYCGSIATGNVLVQVMTPTGPSHNFTIDIQPDGSVKLAFAGIPGWTYRIQYADTLPPVNWTDLSTNTADALGVYQYIDLPPTDAPSRFYRSVSP